MLSPLQRCHTLDFNYILLHLVLNLETRTQLFVHVMTISILLLHLETARRGKGGKERWAKMISGIQIKI